MTSSTASAAAHATGLPPNVENHSVVSAKRSVSSRRVITAATGCPFPIGLPIVTISAGTSFAANDHSPSPARPCPTCTSSAT